MNRNNLKKSGFTLIELLVVIAIIGLLSTLSIVALNSARARSRDARRVADIRQVQTALEMYYNYFNSYPAGSSTTSLTIGSGSNMFMASMPTAPTPADGSCTTNNSYTYTQTDSGASYVLSYCLGAETGGITAGPHTATPATIK